MRILGSALIVYGTLGVVLFEFVQPVVIASFGGAQGLDALRKVAQLLDSAFVIPGTSYRVGLDPILGLFPGLGDLVSPLQGGDACIE